MYSATTRYEYRELAIKRGKRVVLRKRLLSLLPTVTELCIAIYLVGFTIAYFN